MKKKIVFLYSELAEYLMACLEHLEGEGHEVHVVHWPVNPEAPFQLRALKHTQLHPRADFSEAELIAWLSACRPDAVITSGWMDPGYLKALGALHKVHKFQSLLALDNHWHGGLRQLAGSLWARMRYKSLFTQAWVPGKPQVEYVHKLGFDESKILTGFYCADTSSFTHFYLQHPERHSSLPKRFLYVGRYVEFKGIFDLWKAFDYCRKEHPDGANWELLCAGTGALWDQRPELPGLKHLGFIQPSDLPKVLEQAGVFVLPSHKEPWGVVVHEMAAGGLPLICSESIGAASRFLEEGRNGFSFENKNSEALAKAMLTMMDASDEERAIMGQHSHALAQGLTPEVWTKTLLSVI